MTVSPAYARAIDDFDAIVSLQEKVGEARVFRRRRSLVHRAVRVPGHPTSVDRDGVVLALATKAVTTHRAIRLLTDARLASDATALMRVLLENVILIEWLLRDATYRIDLYVESDELHTKHLAAVTAEHYKHRPELVESASARAKRHERAVRAIFGETQKKWARKLSADRQSLLKDNVSIEAMFEEVAQPEEATPGEPAKKSFMRDVVYFQASGHVHSTAFALRRIAKRIANDVIFSLSVHTDDIEFCTETLRGANLISLSAISALNAYGGLGLDTDIDAIVARLPVPAVN
jgi:hypothetical protein